MFFRGLALEPIQAILKVDKEISSILLTQMDSEELVDQRGLERIQKALVAVMDLIIEQSEKSVKTAQLEEERERQLYQKVFSLPSREAADRILRYERSLDRQFKQLLDQLRQLQERRGVNWAA